MVPHDVEDAHADVVPTPAAAGQGRQRPAREGPHLARGRVDVRGQPRRRQGRHPFDQVFLDVGGVLGLVAVPAVPGQGARGGEAQPGEQGGHPFRPARAGVIKQVVGRAEASEQGGRARVGLGGDHAGQDVAHGGRPQGDAPVPAAGGGRPAAAGFAQDKDDGRGEGARLEGQGQARPVRLKGRVDGLGVDGRRAGRPGGRRRGGPAVQAPVQRPPGHGRVARQAQAQVAGRRVLRDGGGQGGVRKGGGV